MTWTCSSRNTDNKFIYDSRCHTSTHVYLQELYTICIWSIDDATLRVVGLHRRSGVFFFLFFLSELLTLLPRPAFQCIMVDDINHFLLCPLHTLLCLLSVTVDAVRYLRFSVFMLECQAYSAYPLHLYATVLHICEDSFWAVHFEGC